MALPRQRRDESDAEFLRRLDEYHCKERARDKRRSKTAERRRYQADYLRKRAAARNDGGSSLRRRPCTSAVLLAERDKAQRRLKAISSEERELLKEKKRYIRKKERMKARMASDAAYAERMRRNSRLRAKRAVDRQKQSGDDRYFRGLLRQRGNAAVRRIRAFGRGRGPFAGEAGERRFIKALRSAFIYGVILFENSEERKAKSRPEYDPEVLLKRGAYSMSCYERMIFDILTDRGVVFEREKEFPWLRNSYTGGAYRVDFYLPEAAVAVEYNGPQHYFTGVFGRDIQYFVRRQCYDVDKYEQLAKHGVRVIVIDYQHDTKAKISRALLDSGVLHG